MLAPYLTASEDESPLQRSDKPSQLQHLDKPKQRYISVDSVEGWKMKDTQRHISVGSAEGWKMKDIQRHKPHVDPRRVFSIYHQMELLELFHKTQYPSRAQKQVLASKFNVSERQIQIWFQNRRARTGKHLEEGAAINMRVWF
ncbi:hypothetical protein PROFUN_08466 [Planoprotostelium fungivorum]|uniref:Homeobox domain-containing protein n=1 Tax=Planoprotostelium fungivorum TaxID=1890364 RepID=A0A2P6N1U7_9EUKA|nr:hypothetical protein PROFUN_08466 [Planoprotostelium fungivorum]